jgi:hypothetical protein
VKHRARIVRLFLAAPFDTAAEKRVIQAAIEDLNRTCGREEHFRIDLLDWKTDAYPGIGADGQDVINRQIGEYDILLGLMSTRYGSPTGRAPSGTVEEFDRAWARFIERPETVRIMFYFHDPEVRLSAIDAYELLQIQRFRRRLQELGVLHWIYTDPNELGIQLRNHLPKTVREVLSVSLPTRPQQSQALQATSQVLIDSWRARKNVHPQWADYLPIPLERYSPRSFSLAGNLYSESPYFRLGFKLFPLAGSEFGDGAIQSHAGANLLVHVGKNMDADRLFLTSYYNGIRQGGNLSLLDYMPPRPLPIEIQVSADDVFSIAVDGTTVHRLHITPIIAERLIVVAWGDEHEFDVHFTDVVLKLG